MAGSRQAGGLGWLRRASPAGSAPGTPLIAPGTPSTAPGRPLPVFALVLYALGLALLLGLGSAYWAVVGDSPLGGVRAGPWRAWPGVGSREADPYARAVVARSGDAPLGIGEGLAFQAFTDEAGRPLDAACTYQVGAATPQARAWTLTLYDRDNRPVASDLERSGFSSAEILYEDNGRFFVALSRDAKPGNWLQLPAAGRFSLVLRLYDTPVSVGSTAFDRRTLPGVERTGCAP